MSILAIILYFTEILYSKLWSLLLRFLLETLALAPQSPMGSDKSLLQMLNYALFWGLQTRDEILLHVLARCSTSAKDKTTLEHSLMWVLSCRKLCPVSGKLLWEGLGSNYLKIL